MITLFRRIRQRLLAKSRLTQYLLYATGEIILVVIGILIALQINNWNEQRKESIAINRVLIEIREDLLQDQIELMRGAVLRKDDLEAQRRIIDALEQKTAYNDTTQSDLGRIHLARKIFSSSKGYELLKELNLGTLRDKKLRILLTRYYERDIQLVHQENVDDNYEFENFWLPYVRTHFKAWEFGVYAIPRDYSQIQEDEVLLTALQINSNNISNTVDAYNTALYTASVLIPLLPDDPVE